MLYGYVTVGCTEWNSSDHLLLINTTFSKRVGTILLFTCIADPSIPLNESMISSTTCENGHWKPNPLDIDCYSTRALHTSMTTISIPLNHYMLSTTLHKSPVTPFSTAASNNYIVYILSSIVCLFILTTIMVTLIVIYQLKYCWRKERSNSATPDQTYNTAVDPIYETISLINEEVSTNSTNPPTPVPELCENHAYSCSGDRNHHAATVAKNPKATQQTFWEIEEPSRVNTTKNEAYSSVQKSEITNKNSTLENITLQRSHSWCLSYPFPIESRLQTQFSSFTN